MGISLAVKYRPKTFTDMVEQTVSTTILQKQLETRTFKNAYLFAGTSGCGKTSAARIFAKEINQGLGQPIEVDGGSAGGVDNIRDILDSANQRDLVSEYKVIIIDECQNLGGGTNKSVWSAMLKGLEECPKYTIFIMCSTDPEKLPTAILNRLQRFNFSPITQDGIKTRLEYICQQEGFIDDGKTCDFISKMAQGSMRTAITYLEQVADYSHNLSLDVAKKVFGGISYETLFKLTWALQNKDERAVLDTFETLYSQGQNLKAFVNFYLNFILDLIKYIEFEYDITAANICIPAYLATDDNPVVQHTVNDFPDSLNFFKALSEVIFEAKQLTRYDTDCKSTIEMLLLKFIRGC